MYRSVLTEVKTGQVIGLPVYNPNDWRTVPLVKERAQISHAVLTRLLDLGVRCLWILDPETEEVDRKIRAETQIAIREFVTSMGQYWEEIRKSLRHIHPSKAGRIQVLDAVRLQDIIRPLADAFRGDRFRVTAVQAQPRLNDPEIDRLVTRVMLSLCLAIDMETEIFLEKLEKIRKYRRALSLKDYQSAKDVTSLGVGAALTDFPDLLNMHVDEGQTVDERVLQTRKEVMLRELEKFSIGTARMMVRIRHQNYDGSGSPKGDYEDNGQQVRRGMQGEEIHLLGRVSRTVDLFVNHLVDNNSWLQALNLMQEQEADKVDPIILDSFLRMLPPFPLGSQVVLNDGSLAVVVSDNSDFPCRPKVVKLGDQLEGGDRHLDLAELPVTSLFIETALDAPGVDCMDHYFSNIKVHMY